MIEVKHELKNELKMKEETALTNNMIEGTCTFINGKVQQMNVAFNRYPLAARKVMLLVSGSSIAMICLYLIIHALSYQTRKETISIEGITQPIMNHMEHNKTTIGTLSLIPLGKMKGEVAGEFEAFYLALDTDGTIYMNRHPPLQNAYLKSPDWKVITKKS